MELDAHLLEERLEIIFDLPDRSTVGSSVAVEKET